MKVVEVEGLRIERDDVVMLDDLSLVIEHGQHWAILGPNGCGKTSFLQALSGYLPGRGEIRVLGERYGSHDWRELRKRIGLVTHALVTSIPPNETALATVVTGREATIGTWSTPSASEHEDAHALLEQIGCSAIAGRPWRVLSQGERQRVLIGRALMSRPALLLLDEPCSGLDPVARERFLAFIDELGALPEAPTLVIVTHHLEEISPVFSHVLMLEGGRTVARGTKEEVLTREHVSRAFGQPLNVIVEAQRYRLVF
jgi:iron complex transport system ATP-binding protein